MKIIGIGGVPASGKSHLIQSYMANVSARLGKPFVPAGYGLAMYEKCGDVYVMGRYQGVAEFPGTDRMSMNCYRHVKMFWRTLASSAPSATVVFEGNRLFKSDVLTFSEGIADTHWMILTTSEEVLHTRHEERRDNQSPRILQARQTEINRLIEAKPNVHVVQNDTAQQSTVTLQALLTLTFGVN